MTDTAQACGSIKRSLIVGGEFMIQDTAQRRAEMSHCRQCGMLCKIGEYHPYAACMMFSHCRDGDTVRANLSAVQQQTRRAALEEARLAVAGEMCDEPDHACGSLQRILDDIDRLAREGVK